MFYIIETIFTRVVTIHIRSARQPTTCHNRRFSDPPSTSRDFWRELDTMPKHRILDYEAWALARGRHLNLDSLWQYQREQYDRAWRCLPPKVLSNGRSSSW